MKRSLLLLGLLVLSASASAQLWSPRQEGNPNVEEEAATVRDDPFLVALPPYPKAENLVRFRGDTDDYLISVDKTSITLKGGEEVRFVMTMKTPGGANNVSYEGLLCRERDRITYAYGSNDGTWVRSRRAQYQHLTRAGIQHYFRDMAATVFCDRRMLAGSVEDMVKALSRPRDEESR